jgi:hypothetical protein
VVVPGTPRNVRINSDAKSEKGVPRLGGTHLGLGRYTVVSRLTIDPTGATIVTRRTVWVVPVWAWIVGALLLVAVAAGITLVVRRFVLASASDPVARTTLDEDAGEDEDEDHDSLEDVDEFSGIEDEDLYDEDDDSESADQLV